MFNLCTSKTQSMNLAIGFLTARDFVRELRDSKAYACSNSDLGEVLFHETQNTELPYEIFFVFPSVEFPKIWWRV